MTAGLERDRGFGTGLEVREREEPDRWVSVETSGSEEKTCARGAYMEGYGAYVDKSRWGWRSCSFSGCNETKRRTYYPLIIEKCGKEPRVTLPSSLVF